MKTKLLGFYKLTRVNDYFAQSFATVSLMATFIEGTINPFVFTHLFLTNLFITAFSFAINDLEDAPDDALDPKKRLRNPISAKLITRSQGLVFTTLLAIISILLVWPFGQLARIIALTCLLLGFLYSYKSVRLKSMPIIDLVSHGLFLGTAQILIAAIGFGLELSPKIYLVALIAFSFSVLSDFYSEIRDYKVDRLSNINNTASIVNVDGIKNKTHYFHVIPAILITLLLLSNFSGQFQIILLGLALIFAFFYLISSEQFRHKIAHQYFKVVLVVTGTILIAVHSFQYF